MTNVVSNPNDFKVVEFTNKTDFDFLTEMGCMYDSRPVFGTQGVHGIKSGESKTLPYHVGHRLATNLAKMVMIKSSPSGQVLDAQGQPIIKSIWSEEAVEKVKNTFLVELYSDAKPVAQTETDRLMAKVEELSKFVKENVGNQPKAITTESSTTITAPVTTSGTAPVYQDKAEVIAELSKRGIKFDARQSKANLEKLVV